jgi:hypothetical protein
MRFPCIVLSSPLGYAAEGKRFFLVLHLLKVG